MRRRQISLGESVHASTSARAHRGGRPHRQLVDQAVEDPVALGVYGFGVGLVLDAVQWRLDPAQLAFG